MTFVDSHAHLDSSEFDGDLDEVISRALSNDVRGILTIGCLNEQREAASAVLQLTESRPGIFASFGVHPHDAQSFDEAAEHQIARLLEHPKVIGVGEIGLDYYYSHSPKRAQRSAFRRQIQLAKKQGKPVIVHSRDAEEETVQILEREFSESSQDAGILHCFTGSVEMAERCLKRGFYVSFGGIITFKNAEGLRKVARRVPLDRLLIETDSPYLAPVPMRGKRNEPAYVIWVARQLAELRGEELEEIGRVTTANFGRLFNVELDSAAEFD
jgi:TatD DNase family protein